ncbi:hypothetical protein CONLIGDRAFT_572532 [Coniochaeta ligniaria NRRL 30616]|uniref:LIM zinc-binding domain-containing protein n=1 Tax=Coniochaeta ligniaria NRRL 30616 TaxID=1408157 RepID=A0A1J7JQC9_9PEZI|nr:hypothetical protein CONLIGDRAFT_572532 [Coniochaeta ligniaria NRRL 30616]
MPRESSFMPTIKCSSCGFEVEISMMGEHICGGSEAQSTQLDPGPSSFDNFMPEKLPRMMPPSLDTSAANRSFAGQGQLTPVSMSSGSRGESPKTPNGRLGPGRSDDYYSPRIATDSPPGQSMRRPGGYGGFADLDGYDVEPAYPGASLKPATNLLQRMNTIAPGPFDAGRRPSAPRNILQTRNAPEEYDRPGTAMSNLSSSAGSMREAPRAPRKNGYGGFGPPSRGGDELEPKPFGMAQRSGTFPRPSDPIDTPARTPSAPGPRPSWRRPSEETAEPMPMTGAGMRRPSKDTSRPPPPRTSLVRSKTFGSSSSNGSVNVAAEFGIGNPYHAPSDSMSSSVSGYSQPSASGRPSQSSSQSSLSRSAGSSFDRKPSDSAGSDSVMGNLRPPMDERKPKELPQSPMQPPPIDKSKPFSKTLAKRPPPPPQGYDPRIDPRLRRAPSPLASPAMEIASPIVDMFARDDPAIQAPRRNRSPEPPPPVPSTRGDCKSCALPITGKSISSADGRLTGRYHKACFVCTTCKEPFTSATFYVLDDKPYCGRHYHELNGSLCGGCGNGIEGQYLEDESTKKHHPGCFRCGDCGMVLKDGYFEVNGRAFCEKDAWRRVQQPWMAGRKGSTPSASPLGLPAGPGGPRSGSFGLPSNNRMGPGFVPRPRMEKRMTRLGMM